MFSRGEANVPTLARAEALQAELRAAGLLPEAAAARDDLPAQLFREDLYREALTHADLPVMNAVH